MVAYSFKPRFVAPIQVGLGHIKSDLIFPKRQTIRAPRGGHGHARPGQVMHLFCQQRSVDGFRIGEAICVMETPIILRFTAAETEWGLDYVESPATGLLGTRHDLDAFARRDGFKSWFDLRNFWAEEHPGVEEFTGHLLMWEAKS